ncbi:MAG: OmpA family protein [Bacteroidetes bacterium]|nr:OmpA family protein [Bacteroidota bacterium]
MRTIILFLFTIGLIFPTANLVAQDNEVDPLDPSIYGWVPDSNKIKNKRIQQHRDFVAKLSPYPAKTRHWTTLSVAGGLMFTSGDVKSRPGWNVGLRYRWNLGYIASMRVDFRHGVSYGQNYEPKDLVGSLEENQLTRIHNQAYVRAGGQELEDLDALVNYADFGYYLAYDNYKNEITDASLSVMFHLNNFKYHRENTWFNAYVFMGIGGMLYKTSVDALYEDDNGLESIPYNYVEFLNSGLVKGELNEDLLKALEDGIVQPGERKIVREALADLYGGKALKRSYETPAEGHKNEESLFGRVFNPTFHVGAAIDFLIGEKERVTLGLETKHTFTNDDLVDGQRWTVQGDLTRDYDTYNQSTITVGINIGKKPEKSNAPMWWENPNRGVYTILQNQPDVAKLIEEITPTDSDNDGVPDKLDQEPDTPEEALVDSKGNTKDSDADGCPDHEDPEPYSTPLLPIVDCKNVYDFAEKECCDEQATVVTMVPCREIELPSIHFDDDKYYVKPEFYAHLHEIARKMQDCPDLKVVANGHTDTNDDIKYNEQLSWNRVNSSIDYLVEKYGISRDRFVVKYSGEREPLTGDESSFEKYQNRRVEFRFAEDGEEGDSNPPAPHPGIKAGSNK